MDAAAQAIARQAAERLSTAYGAGLPPMVERALAFRDAAPERYAGLDRAIATAALARELRIKVELPGGLTIEDRDRVISVIVEEATHLSSISNVR